MRTLAWGLGRRIFLWLTVVLVAAALILGGAVYIGLRRSLPRLQGDLTLAGLSAPVTISRDAGGVPRIEAQSRGDAIHGLGFVHGQERFFQMDLQRRKAAGELAEMFGDVALVVDRQSRVHRFRHRAQQGLDRLRTDEPDLVALVDAYTTGVNDGLRDLGASPFEYSILGVSPEPWRPADCLLTIFAMYMQLQGSRPAAESARGVMEDTLPASLVKFLAPPGTSLDAPLLGAPWPALPLPSPAEVDLRQTNPTSPTLSAPDPAPSGGSNNWAVTGAHSTHGGAILANDMHLGHGVPNIWFRAVWSYPAGGGDGQRIRLAGITLPGLPALVVGSNGRTAWGYTNSQGDWADLVLIETDDAEYYNTTQGRLPFTVVKEVLNTKDGGVEVLEVRETIWGPVWDSDHHGRQRVLSWVAHRPAGINLNLMKLDSADSVGEALDIARSAGMPAQNFVAADAAGDIGWTISGPIPLRPGHTGLVPRSWVRGDRGWHGWLAAADYPRIENPPSGRLWTANNRTVDGAWYRLLGEGGLALGARARGIRDGLLAVKKIDETGMFELQLVTDAPWLDRWHRLFKETLETSAGAEKDYHGMLLAAVEPWQAKATVDSVAYRVVRAFRNHAIRRALEPLVAPCAAADPDFPGVHFSRQRESAAWRLLEEKPQHLLDPRFESWRALLLEAADAVWDEVVVDGGRLSGFTWGARNMADIRHPLSRHVPGVGLLVDMPKQALPGDSKTTRVQRPRFGASQRMVVSPGREEQGIFHMPVGQSGHPLSPYFGAGHQDWVEGNPTPFLPGDPVYVLNLLPDAAE